ncbi:hypothetical protein ONS95_004346 [Cadophora gregata]|uniref:uncharacterized protein n=1 Tax=Cadophora gregata TaxID=51156 RepID=UPI0026DDC4D6|nr:uncharacterized protein ONS95_004346 [Cadophora gregata]KAK0105268.1 hypothetical protein ONS96_004665 [Cadophora gregata f. sp. sojae]KAK0105831.1 hypothetical protein ONS95_004346 [Cadophora gregata]
MTLNNCIICNNAANKRCSNCKSAAYCSTRCQGIDYPLHKLLCSEMTSFLSSNPRPKDTITETHKLAILFPEHGTIPKLVWARSETYSEEEDGDKEVSIHVEEHVPGATGCEYVFASGYNLEIYMSDHAVGTCGPTESIYASTSGFDIPAGRWLGPVIVV